MSPARCGKDHPKPRTGASIYMAWADKPAATHCARGHAFTDKNTRLSHGRRHCRRCVALRSKLAKAGVRVEADMRFKANRAAFPVESARA